MQNREKTLNDLDYQTVLQHRISPDVVEGENMLFLSGGGHTIEEYLFGLKKIPSQSFTNFKENLDFRASFSEKIGAKYIHVVCPDKHVIYPEKYPVHFFESLGQQYQRITRADFIYPVKELIENKRNELTYRTGDTHWNDYGAHTVLRTILTKFGLDADSFFDKYQWSAQFKIYERNDGDLSKKINNSFAEQVKVYHRDLSSTIYFDNNFNKNNGVIKTYYTHNAELKKKIVIFADSFTELLLPFLSKIFEHVIFIRSPFYYLDIIASLKPDFVLTAQAERYLSFVQSDKKAGIGYYAAFFRQHSFDHNNNIYQYLNILSTDEKTDMEDFLIKTLSEKWGNGNYEPVISILSSYQPLRDTTEILLLKSKMYLRNRKLELAWQYAEQAIVVSNRAFSILVHASAVKILMNDNDAVIQLSQEVLNQQPKIWVAHRNLAQAYLNQGKSEQAKNHATLAAELSNNNPTVLSLLQKLQ